MQIRGWLEDMPRRLVIALLATSMVLSGLPAPALAEIAEATTEKTAAISIDEDGETDELADLTSQLQDDETADELEADSEASDDDELSADKQEGSSYADEPAEETETTSDSDNQQQMASNEEVEDMAVEDEMGAPEEDGEPEPSEAPDSLTTYSDVDADAAGATLVTAYKGVLTQARAGEGVYRDNYVKSTNNGRTDVNGWKGSVTYSLYDIDANGIPELLVFTGFITAYMATDYYTYRNGEAVYLGRLGMVSWHGTPTGLLYSAYTRQGLSVASLVTISDSKICATKVYENYDPNGYDRDGDVYRYINRIGASQLTTSSSTSYSLLNNYSSITAATSQQGKLISDAKVTVNGKASSSNVEVIWTGSAVKPTLSVKVGSTTLKQGTDYTISYSNNVNPGNAIITISGKGNYRGKQHVAFTICQKSGAWVKSGSRWWYRYSDGTYPKSTILTINGKEYYFDSAGWMVTGWAKVSGYWYYFASSGTMTKSAWVKSGGLWYWLGDDGRMISNTWRVINGAKYYFESNGAMVTGWKKISGKWYYFESSGAMAKSRWVGNYYVQADGTMATCKWIGNYHVGADGKWDKTR